MSQRTSIEWTDVSWNPVHGCSKVSEGCDHCYAETMSLRRGQTAKPWTPENAAENVLLKPHKLREPLSKAGPWKQPCRVFVNSMSDLFHPRVPGGYIDRVWDVMEEASQHTFQVLTKRPKRMCSWVERWRPEPLPNVWLGTSIETRKWVQRADHLRQTPAAVRFISAEPLLGPLFAPWWGDPTDALDLTGIDWLIVGGESGSGRRPMEAEWARDLRDAARESDTAFFFKQWGGHIPKAGGRVLDGRTWDEYPTPVAA